VFILSTQAGFIHSPGSFSKAKSVVCPGRSRREPYNMKGNDSPKLTQQISGGIRDRDSLVAPRCPDWAASVLPGGRESPGTARGLTLHCVRLTRQQTEGQTKPLSCLSALESCSDTWNSDITRTEPWFLLQPSCLSDFSSILIP